MRKYQILQKSANLICIIKLILMVKGNTYLADVP